MFELKIWLNLIRFLLVFALFFILSCNDDLKLNETESNFNYSSFKVKEKLKFEELNTLEGLAYGINSYDSLLIIYEVGKSDAISIYSKNTGVFINSDLTIGKGPNEVIAIFGYGIINDSIFWAYEGETETIRYYHIADILNKAKAEIFRTIHFELERYAYKIIPFSIDTFLLTGCPSYKSKLTILNDKGTVVDSFGKFTNLTISDYTFLKGAYMYNLVIKPDRKAVAFDYFRSDVIEIYDINGMLINVIHGPNNFDVDPRPTDKNMSEYFKYSNETRYAFINIKTSDKYIYALYDGGSAVNPNPVGKFIFVFDWNGNPVKLFELTEGINVFEVDEENKKIYAASLLTGNIIIANFDI